jgi:hypothetical protein
MIRTECRITGCVLVHPEGHVAYNGDLFEQGDTYIVNCNEASAHTPPEHFDKGVKWIRPTGDHYWERRGVWVFQTDSADHSIAALEYMGK